MKSARRFLWYAAASTVLYEILVSSPWWTGARHERYDMLLNLAAPSVILLLFAYYLLQKMQPNYSMALGFFIIILQIAILLTIYGTIRGLL